MNDARDTLGQGLVSVRVTLVMAFDLGRSNPRPKSYTTGVPKNVALSVATHYRMRSEMLLAFVRVTLTMTFDFGVKSKVKVEGVRKTGLCDPGTEKRHHNSSRISNEWFPEIP